MEHIKSYNKTPPDLRKFYYRVHHVWPSQNERLKQKTDTQSVINHDEKNLDNKIERRITVISEVKSVVFGSFKHP